MVMITQTFHMKKIYFFSFIGLLLCQSAICQDHEKYTRLVNDAWNLYQDKAYLESGKKYTEAFVANGNKGIINDRYNAACSWALANQVDSAFVQLFKIAQNGNYTNYNHLTTDPDLKSLYEDPRWEEVTALVKSNKEKGEANFDKPLVAILDTIFQEDQKYRLQIGEIEQKYGRQSDEMQAHWNLIMKKDSINLLKVQKILDERGWLGPSIIGNQGNQTLFLVIQHSELSIQEKYLPMMREAVQKGNANASSLALLEDRVALRQGRRQTYGSQISRDEETGAFYVSPLDDPDNVDERRAMVGLQPLQDYVSRWGITWDVAAYKLMLPEIEAKEKEKKK